MAAQYTLVYHAIARNVSQARLGVAMQLPNIDAQFLLELGLVLDSDDLADEGLSGVSRTLKYHPDGSGVLTNDQIPGALENVLTSAIAAEIVSPVTADPVAGP